MKESYRKGVANHPGPESCRQINYEALEALTGGSAGQPLSPERCSSGVPTPIPCGGRQQRQARNREGLPHPSGSQNLACVDTSCPESGRASGRPRKKVPWSADGTS